jgi:hypothetical protein
MIDNISIVSILFDYPEKKYPTFYNNALKYFSKQNIHVARYSKLIESECYYTKLYFYKIEKLLEYVKNNIKTEFMLFLDATDTNFLKDPSNLEKDFKAFNCSILFCAEKGLWPPTEYNHLYSNKRTISDKKYLNSGAYIGYTEKIIEYLQIIIDDNRGHKDDQAKWAIQYLHKDDIVIDQECNIFFSSYLAKNDINFENQVPSLKNLNAYIVHDNGPWGDETLKIVSFL